MHHSFLDYLIHFWLLINDYGCEQNNNILKFIIVLYDSINTQIKVFFKTINSVEIIALQYYSTSWHDGDYTSSHTSTIWV